MPKRMGKASDVAFDKKGRLVILSPELNRSIADILTRQGRVEVLADLKNSARTLPKVGPHPPDGLCGCRDYLQMTKLATARRTVSAQPSTSARRGPARERSH